jgi:hypothetical protein
MPEPKQKRYIVRKYIFARSASDAIRKDKTAPVDDVWLDEKWDEQAVKQVGFSTGKK